MIVTKQDNRGLLHEQCMSWVKAWRLLDTFDLTMTIGIMAGELTSLVVVGLHTIVAVVHQCDVLDGIIGHRITIPIRTPEWY